METSPIPEAWLDALPETLVVGTGPYSAALAFALGTAVVSFDRLSLSPTRSADGSYTLVLEELTHVFLVIPEDATPSDVFGCHRSVWHWVEKLSSKHDQHDLAFVFVLSERCAKAFDEALAIGLAFPLAQAPALGHAIWRRSGSLVGLLDLAASVRPQDHLVLTRRLAAEPRRTALRRLRDEVKRSDLSAAIAAARAVISAFQDNLYQLDEFCRAPCHPHGNEFRSWLQASVTDAVTQDWCAAGRKGLADWLDEENLS